MTGVMGGDNMAVGIDERATLQTKQRYNSIARVYDAVEMMMAGQFRRGREAG